MKSVNDVRKDLLVNHQKESWDKSDFPLDKARELIGGLPDTSIAAIASGSIYGDPALHNDLTHIFGVELCRLDVHDHPEVFNFDSYQFYYNATNDTYWCSVPNTKLSYHHSDGTNLHAVAEQAVYDGCIRWFYYLNFRSEKSLAIPCSAKT